MGASVDQAALATLRESKDRTMKYKSNEQFVKDIMAFSRRGPLAQIFVVEAIRKYAEACAEADPAVFDSPLMNGAAWVDVAKEIRDKMNEWKAS